MKIEEGKFYFLKQSFFRKMKDSNLASNKDKRNIIRRIKGWR